MIDSIVWFFRRGDGHDYWGVADDLIWSRSTIGADLLAVICACMGIRGQ